MKLLNVWSVGAVAVWSCCLLHDWLVGTLDCMMCGSSNYKLRRQLHRSSNPTFQYTNNSTIQSPTNPRIQTSTLPQLPNSKIQHVKQSTTPTIQPPLIYNIQAHIISILQKSKVWGICSEQHSVTRCWLCDCWSGGPTAGALGNA